MEVLGEELTAHYAKDPRPLVVVGVLSGSFLFLADLVRHILLPLEVEFMVASSYGDAMTSSGTVELLPLRQEGTTYRDRHVLVVEDILDTGRTLKEIQGFIQKEQPASLEVCTLLHKYKANALADAKWVGFPAPDEFLVGYGLDHAGHYRNLPSIGYIST